MSSARKSNDFDGISTYKTVTPALLSHPLPTSLNPSPSPDSSNSPDFPQSADGKTSKFLSNREHRIFPLNLPHRSESTEPQKDMMQTGANLRSPSPVSRRPKHRKNWSMIEEEKKSGFREKKETVKLPELKYRTYKGKARGTERSWGKSQYYDDFVIGGNSYNQGIEDRLYRPQVIHITPKTHIRLYTRYYKQPLSKTPSPGGTQREAKPSNVLANSKLNANLKRKDSESDIVYDTPALTYGQKLERIKKLAENTITMLK